VVPGVLDHDKYAEWPQKKMAKPSLKNKASVFHEYETQPERKRTKPSLKNEARVFHEYET
jgi:hypothetical protein